MLLKDYKDYIPYQIQLGKDMMESYIETITRGWESPKYSRILILLLHLEQEDSTHLTYLTNTKTVIP